MWKISFFINFLHSFLTISATNDKRIEILMPNVTTQNEDSYMATYYKLGDDERYITSIEPLTNAKIAHHMFVYGCDKPSQLKSYWEGADVCRGQKALLFAWGLNAKALELPEDVNFKVGPETAIKYLIINIHYLNKAASDHSGVAINFTKIKRRFEAGIMILMPFNFQIPPLTKEYSTSLSCKYTGKDLIAFAVRVHAHAHGDVNTAYRVRNGDWTQIAKGDPQLPQAFYPMEKMLGIKEGDILLGMCTYHNNENRTIYPGSTHTDEMCNIYIMYYTENAQEVMSTCAGNSYPALEQKIPTDAKVKPIHIGGEVNQDEQGHNHEPDHNHEENPVTTSSPKVTEWRFDEDEADPTWYDKRIEMRMPNVTTEHEDTYIVSSFKLKDDERYITMIKPLTNAKIAHHMFVYGCEEPALTGAKYWEGANACNGAQMMIFAWGLDAKALILPEDVNFKVGPETNIKYLVINVHYLNKATNDESGVAVYFSNKKHTYEAGIMLLIPNYFEIPPLTKEYSTSLSCKYTGKDLIAFAVRVHAHVHGDVNTAYRVRNGDWTQIVKGDPQLPQAFYPMKQVLEIKEGDILLGMCTYHNNETRTVYPGSTHTDEMCNIYIMYYTQNAQEVMSMCSGNSNPELEQKIPADAKIKPINNKDSSSPSSTALNEHQHPYLSSIGNQKKYFLVTFVILALFSFLVSILFLIKRQKKRNKNSIIRFKQISSSVPDKNRSRYDWIRNWTLNRNRQINFSKLNQNDEDDDDESGREEKVRFNKGNGAPVTENLSTDSESEDVVMSLNR